MARAQRADEERSLSPAEYFKKYCVAEEIGRSLRVLKSGADRGKSDNNSEKIDQDGDYSVVNSTVRKNTPLHLTEEFQRHARENQWSTRKERGIVGRKSIFDFLGEVYGGWIEEGMTRADLRHVDFQAWQALQNALKRQPMPESLRLPKQCDASLPEPGTKAYEDRMRARELNRTRMQLLNSPGYE